ncbi:MAG TPA: hypothetical protein VMV19_18440 [Xanthobacteraceae bacterium]|nr:hypothetical protein [Xanthobacteraceae bacterium]
MGNPRARGKIAHSEWPKIAARVGTGESLAAVARSYQCTAPAIRYIVRRMPDAQTAAGGDEGRRRLQAPLALAAAGRQESSSPLSRSARGTALDHALWSRVNGDIAAFLSAVDALMAEHTAENEEALLSATDGLLRATARTRVEIEKAMGRYPALERRTGSDR